MKFTRTFIIFCALGAALAGTTALAASDARDTVSDKTVAADGAVVCA